MKKRAKANSLVETEVSFISQELSKFAPEGERDAHFIGMVYAIDHNYSDWD